MVNTFNEWSFLASFLYNIEKILYEQLLLHFTYYFFAVFYHSSKPTFDVNDLTIVELDVASICLGNQDSSPLDIIILVILETILLVVILAKV